MAKITKAQRDFVNYFIEQDFKNAAEAYRKAYPKVSNETARANASRLLTNTNIQEIIAETITEILKKDKIPLEKRLFDYWMKRAFYDITEIIDVKGKMKLNDKQLRERGLTVCIDSINKKINAQGIETLVYEFADKDKAAEMLQRYIQMIKPARQEVDVSGGLQLVRVTDGEAAGLDYGRMNLTPRQSDLYRLISAGRVILAEGGARSGTYRGFLCGLPRGGAFFTSSSISFGYNDS
jgi:phage terminase small subunit